MHDNSFCRDYFHKNIMQPFMKKIMEIKGQKIMYLNQILKNMKRKQPEKRGRMFQNKAGINIHKKRMHAVLVKISSRSDQFARSDSVLSSKSTQSIRSPSPKKINITMN